MFNSHYSNFNHYISISNIKESIKNKKPKKFLTTKGITAIREVTGLTIEQFNLLINKLKDPFYLTNTF